MLLFRKEISEESRAERDFRNLTTVIRKYKTESDVDKALNAVKGDWKAHHDFVRVKTEDEKEAAPVDKIESDDPFLPHKDEPKDE